MQITCHLLSADSAMLLSSAVRDGIFMDNPNQCKYYRESCFYPNRNATEGKVMPFLVVDGQCAHGRVQLNTAVIFSSQTWIFAAFCPTCYASAEKCPFTHCC